MSWTKHCLLGLAAPILLFARPFAMETVTRRLLRALSPKKDAESFLLPFVSGQPFDTTSIAVDAAELVEKLCYERFWGCVYFQHDGQSQGAQHGVVAVADDAITGALWASAGAQTTGAAAWQAIRALDFLPECLAIETGAPLVEAYATLLNGAKPLNGAADESSLSLCIENMVLSRGTGALRVTDGGKQWFEFWHQGAALGLFQSVEGASNLQKIEATWWHTERGKGARLDVWREVSAPIWHSPLSFCGREARALAGLLGIAYDLASAMAPPAQARALWDEALARHPELKLAVDMAAPKRAPLLESAVKTTTLAGAQCAALIGHLVDDFLAEWARAIGTKLFAARAALAFSGEQKAVLSGLNVHLKTIDLAAPDDGATELSAPKRLVCAIDALRFKAAPRRNLARASSFDF